MNLRVIRIFLSAGAFTLCACATPFRGPGSLQSPLANDPSHSSTTESITQPTASNAPLSMGGERGFSRTEESVHFDWPVDDARMTRGFMASPSKRKRSHWGVDLANKKGTPILATEKGTVIYTGAAFHGYGKLIVIEHGSEWASLYSHLNKILVNEGQVIQKGEKIAEMGRTGRATGVHLHFELRHFRQPVNPLAYLPQGSIGPSRIGGWRREDSTQLMSRNTQ